MRHELCEAILIRLNAKVGLVDRKPKFVWVNHCAAFLENSNGLQPLDAVRDQIASETHFTRQFRKGNTRVTVQFKRILRSSRSIDSAMGNAPIRGLYLR